MNLSNEDNECLICYETLQDINITTILCGHKFHYDCIVESYRTSNFEQKQRCPYCRKKGGWIPKPKNKPFIQDVHKDTTLCKGTKKKKCKNKGIYNGYCIIHRYSKNCE